MICCPLQHHHYSCLLVKASAHMLFDGAMNGRVRTSVYTYTRSREQNKIVNCVSIMIDNKARLDFLQFLQRESNTKYKHDE